MFDYGKLVFLDNQKTGSSYVAQFLEACCTLDRIHYHRPMKHVPVRDRYRPDTVYFTTVRNPLDLYSSLFRYGQDKKGNTWKRLRKMGLLHLYESYPKWLEFVLDEKNAHTFQEGYERFADMGVGLMTFRSMRITMAYPIRDLLKGKDYDSVIRIWEGRNIANHTFLQEKLNDSLRNFAENTVPEFFDMDKVNAFLTSDVQVNVTGVKADLAIPDSLRATVEEKERFLLRKFYASPGIPPVPRRPAARR